MENGNGSRAKWMVVTGIGSIVAVALALVTFASGLLTGTKTSAAVMQRMESHLEESKDHGKEIADIKAHELVTDERIRQLIQSQDRLNESQGRTDELLQVYLQSLMKQGRVPR